MRENGMVALHSHAYNKFLLMDDPHFDISLQCPVADRSSDMHRRVFADSAVCCWSCKDVFRHLGPGRTAANSPMAGAGRLLSLFPWPSTRTILRSPCGILLTTASCRSLQHAGCRSPALASQAGRP